MANYTSLLVNTTQISGFAALSIRLPLIIVLVLFLVFFLYFGFLMVGTFFTCEGLRDHTRYVLFVYMLINDTAYVFTSVLLAVVAILALKMPAPVCHVIVTIASSTFQGTPSTLALMALERFVAICLPLRHAEICRVERCWMAITFICVTACLPSLVDIIVMVSFVKQTIFLQMITCYRGAFLVTMIQSTLRYVMHGTTFTVVALIIAYTYIRVMLEAKKINGDKTSSSRASKTLLLHAVQLLLCMMSFTYPITEVYFKNILELPIINLLTFMLLPRILSPMIYGLRDETIRNHIYKHMPHLSCKTNSGTANTCIVFKT